MISSDTARLSVADLAQRVIAAKGFDRTAAGYVKSIGPKYETAARLLDEVADKPAIAITRKDVVALARLLARAPKNLKQLGHRGTLRQAIAANDRARDPRPRLSPTTIEFGFLSPLRQIFAHCRDIVPDNPAAGVHPHDLPAPRQRKAGARRPFPLKALNTIFASPLYAGCESAAHWHRYGTHVDDRLCRYWMPLLMLHAGLRASEIVGLAGDALESVEGLPCLRIAGRLAPVHLNLIGLGFLELFDGTTRPLFPEACGRAALALRGFNDPARFLDSLALKAAETPIDSLRLNYRQAIERVFSATISAALQGRAGGAAIDPAALRRFFHEVDFPGLDLTRIRNAQGGLAWNEARIDAALARLSRLPVECVAESPDAKNPVQIAPAARRFGAAVSYPE